MALQSIMAGLASRMLNSAYSSAQGLGESSHGPETGTGPDNGCRGVMVLLPVITNNSEQSPYLLTSKRI